MPSVLSVSRRPASLFPCPFCRKPYQKSGHQVNHVKSTHPELYERWLRPKVAPPPTKKDLKRKRADTTTNDLVPEPPVVGQPDTVPLQLNDIDEWDSNAEHDQDSSDDDQEGDLEATEGELKHVYRKYATEREPGYCYKPHDLPGEWSPPDTTINVEEASWGPFDSEPEFELARWFITHDIKHTAIEAYYKLCKRFPESFHGGKFTSAYTLLKAVDKMPEGMELKQWSTAYANVRLPEDRTNEPTTDGKTSADGYETWMYRDPIKAIAPLLAQKRLDGEVVYQPHQEFNTADNSRIYSEIHTGNWMWDMQFQIDTRGTVLALILMSDQTHLSSFSGDQKLYPLWCTIGNIRERTRQKPSKHCSVLLALLPLPAKHSAAGPGKTAKQERQRAHYRATLCEAIGIILRPLKVSMQYGAFLRCPDGNVRRWYPRIAAWIADHAENTLLHSVKGRHCVICETPENEFGGTPTGSQLIHRQGHLYLEHWKRYMNSSVPDQQRKAEKAWLDSRGVKPLEGMFWRHHDPAYFDTNTLAVPDVLHTIYLGILDHLMKWITAFLEHHKRLERFNQIWRQTPPYPGLKTFTKDYLAVTQWSGKEMRHLGRIILPVLAATLRRPTAEQRPEFERALVCTRSIIHFHLIAQYRSHTDLTLRYMDHYLTAFHDTKDIFLRHRSGKLAKSSGAVLQQDLQNSMAVKRREDPNYTRLDVAGKRARERADQEMIKDRVQAHVLEKTDFAFVKLHYLSHLSDHIPRLGNLHSFSAELMEYSHQILKNGYRASNRVNATPQLLTYYTRHRSFDTIQLSLEARSRLIEAGYETTGPIPRRLQGLYRPPKGTTPMNSIASVAEGYGFNLGEFCSRIMSYLKTYHPERHRSTRLDHDIIEHWSCAVFNSLSLGNLRFGTADEEVKVAVRCTGRRMWRTIYPPRNDWVFIWTGDKSKYGDLEGRLPARLCCLFKFHDSLGQPHRCAFVHTVIPTIQDDEPIQPRATGGTRSAQHDRRKQDPGCKHHISGLISVKLGSKSSRNNGSAGSTFVVPIRRIMFPAHLIKQDPGDDNTRFFVNSTIDLTHWNELDTKVPEGFI